MLARSQVVLGVSASPRHAGFGLVINGQPSLLPTIRFRKHVTAETARRRVERALGRWLRSVTSAAIAVDQCARDTAEDSAVVRAALDAVDGVASRCRLGVIPVGRAEIEKGLGIDRTSDIGIVRALAQKFPALGTYVTTERTGRRSEQERHREPSFVALACALTITGNYHGHETPPTP